MAGRGNISRRAQSLAEILLVLVPTGTALFLSGIPVALKSVGFALATVFVSVAKYFTVYRQREKLRELKKEEFLGHHLELMISDYERTYSPSHDIRVNVMLPQDRQTISREGLSFDHSHDRYLQIAYCAGGGIDKDIREHDCGEADETTTPWSIDQPAEGNCGRAFVTGETRVAGRVPSEDEWVGQETTRRQDQDTRAVNSVLSVPILGDEGGEPEAILNVDASAPLRETNFESESVQQFIRENYADRLAKVV